MPGNRRKYGSVKTFKKKKLCHGKVGYINSKSTLKIAFINVNGLSQKSNIDIQNLIDVKGPDVIGLVETHRVLEQIGDKIDFPGYKCFENCRSYEKNGGGLAVLCKTGDGLRINQYNPKTIHPDLLSVNSERIWITVESEKNITSICFLYLGCQYKDSRYAQHNNKIS